MSRTGDFTSSALEEDDVLDVGGVGEHVRCMGKEQMIRYASILFDIADGTKRDFDELI